MVWHIWSFVSVAISGVLLSVSTIKTWDNPKFFYATYIAIVLLVFLCELPFIYIINKIVSQAVIAKEREF
jgi:hypothetical protein